MLHKIGSSTPWFTNQWFALMNASGTQDGNVVDFTQAGVIARAGTRRGSCAMELMHAFPNSVDEVSMRLLMRFALPAVFIVFLASGCGAPSSPLDSVPVAAPTARPKTPDAPPLPPRPPK